MDEREVGFRDPLSETGGRIRLSSAGGSRPGVSRIRRLLRTILGFGLLVYLLLELDTSSIAEALFDLRAGALAAAIVAQLAIKVLFVGRWREILLATGLRRKFGDLLSLLFIGLFFNNLLPTSVGGDLVRGYYASRAKGERMLSYGVVLVERLLGLVTLAAVAALACFAALLSGGTQIDPKILWTVGMLAVLAAVGGSSIFASATLARRWLRGEILGFRLEDFTDALSLFKHPRSPKVLIVAYSLALQVTAILFYLTCARAVGLDAPAIDLVIAVPVAIAASMVPLTVNGLGVREGIFVALLATSGSSPERAAAAAVLARAVAFAFALIGGLIYPFYKRKDSPTADG